MWFLAGFISGMTYTVVIIMVIVAIVWVREERLEAKNQLREQAEQEAPSA